jgi:hypothetical protein
MPGRLVIVGISRRELDHPGSARGVGYEVDLGGPAADAATDGLLLGPPFPPLAVRCALMIVESINSRSGCPKHFASSVNIFSQMPRLAHRTKRL